MIKTWAVTDTGLVRKENQDTYRIARNGDICVVCDGMGGAAHTIAHHTDVTVPGDPVSILIFLSHKASIRNGPGFYHDSAAPFFRSSISFRRSWPQEASISPPRLRRTVAVRP